MASNIFWGAIVLDTFKYLYSDDLKITELKILFYLLSNINYTNNIASVKQLEISESLGIHKSTVSKALANLEELQYVSRVSKFNGYMVNPHMFYVGKTKEQERTALREAFDYLVSESGRKVRFEVDEYLGVLADNTMKTNISSYDNKMDIVSNKIFNNLMNSKKPPSK